MRWDRSSVGQKQRVTLSDVYKTFKTEKLFTEHKQGLTLELQEAVQTILTMCQKQDEAVSVSIFSSAEMGCTNKILAQKRNRTKFKISDQTEWCRGD